MSSSVSDHHDLLDLFDAYLGDDISDSDAVLMMDRLRRDDAARLLYIEYVDLQAELIQLVGGGNTPQNVRLDAGVKRRRWGRLIAGSVAAAVVVVAACTVTWMAQEQHEHLAAQEAFEAPAPADPAEPLLPPFVATITREAGATWIDAPFPAVGGTLRPGEYLELSAGTAEIEFSSGARCILAGPAGLFARTGLSCELIHGMATFRAETSAHGFRVTTPGGDIVDLGTEFGVSMAPYGQSEVHVFDGTVQASAKSGAGAVVTLSRGRAALLDPIADQTRTISFDGEKFSRPLAFAAGIVDYSSTVAFLPFPPSSLRVNDFGGRDKAIMLVERDGVQLAGELRVDATTGANTGPLVEYAGRNAGAMAGAATIAAGTRVDSLLVHFAGFPGSDDWAHIEGEISFAEPILAVIVEAKQLLATSPQLGHPRTAYPGGSVVGLEDSKVRPDRVVVSEDRRHIQFQMHTTRGNVDEMRILRPHRHP